MGKDFNIFGFMTQVTLNIIFKILVSSESIVDRKIAYYKPDGSMEMLHPT